MRETEVLAHGFVGRAREAEILRDAVHDVVAGRGRLVLLAGEPGIGKTRLAEEAAIYAQASGMRVLWGRCWEGGGAPAFWPWIQLIRGSLAPSGWSDQMLAAVKPGLACIARMVPELRSTLPIPTPVPEHTPALGDASRGPGSERFRLLDAITTLFKELAAGTPLMMVLDDLHAADEDSLVLLRFLARELKQIRILVVGTYRDVEVRQSAQKAALLADIGREGSTVPLAGLNLDAVADFIHRIAKLPADDELVSRLHHVTGGNPFFLDEIVRLMIARNGFDEDADAVSDFAIPDSVRAVIRRRIAPFDERTKSLLTTAAVIGNEFDLAVLGDVSGIPTEQLTESLAAAAVNAVIVEPADPAGAYRFSHAIVTEALCADLGTMTRVQLHQRIAAALERVHAGDLTPHLAQLAHHCIEALSIGGADKAVEYSRRGAANACDQLAFAEGVRLYEMALRALAATAQPDDEQRCQLLLAMGEAQAQGGSLDEAREAFERAADAARRIGRPPLLAQCALQASEWFGTFFTLDRVLMALVEEALHAADGGDSTVRCSLMAVLASERYWSGDRERGLALCEDAVTMARRLGDSRSLVSALWVKSQIRWGPEDVEGRLAAATEVAELAESIGDHQRALRAHEMRFTALLELGDMQGLEAEIRSYEALAETAGEQFGIVERFHAVLALLRGEFAQAQRQIEELRAHAERRQDPALLACAQALSGALWEEQGSLRPSQVELAANTLISQSPALAAQYRVILALVNLASGRRAEAAADLDALTADDCAAIPRDWNWLDNLRGLAILCLVLRDAGRGAILYELMRPYAARNITAGWGDVARGSAALYLGSLARQLGRLEDAEEHLALALQFNQRMGARPSVARTQFEYARVLLERDRPGNQEQARAMLAAALATACELGMKPLEMRVRMLLERKGWPQDVPVEERPAPDPIEAVAAAVAAEPRDLRAHAAPDGTVTILISDIKDSSALFDTLGDLRAHEIIDAHNAIVRQQVALQKGFVVKSMGDGFMVAFSSARRAVLCAIAMQRAFTSYSEQHRETPIQVRMGLHVGEPINVSDDLYGKPVIVAARIAALAHEREILVSSTLRDLTESAGDLRFSDAGTVQLKGLSGSHHLHRVIW